jgi:hypothetical protein
MFGKSKEELKKEANRERVRRFREKQKNTTVTQPLQSNVKAVTNTVTSKMVCKCQYFKYVDGKLVCSVCGRPPGDQSVKDKIANSEVK